MLCLSFLKFRRGVFVIGPGSLKDFLVQGISVGKSSFAVKVTLESDDDLSSSAWPQWPADGG